MPTFPAPIARACAYSYVPCAVAQNPVFRGSDMNHGRRQVPPARRVLIVDDQPIYALGLRVLLGREEGMDACGVVDSASAARAAIKQQNPDAVIIAISL